MYIKKLIIKNYKSIKDETFVFNKGINVLVGKNNAGKSNIVLALNEILDDKYNATSYEDRIFYCNENNGYEKNFKIITEIDEINNLDYSLLDITSYFNESDENFDNEWVINDDELKEKYPDLFNYRGTNLLIWKKTEELKKILDNMQKKLDI